jgi:rhodanese-related sulfurtransferase
MSALMKRHSWLSWGLMAFGAVGGGGWLAQVDGTPGRDPRVDALDVAAWLRDDPTQLRILDVRSQEEFDDFHIPRAERAPLDSLAMMRGSRESQVDNGPGGPSEVDGSEARILVVHGSDRAESLRAWTAARKGGSGPVHFMEDAIAEWTDQILSPVLLIGASVQEEEAFEEQAELARFFGGFPRTGVAALPETSAKERLAKARRRGCGF